MDKYNHPLARCASYLLIYLTALQPLHPAFAAGINAANGNSQVIIKPGNVPVVNVATPNGAGISHNTYKDFNVGTPGAVLNNSTQGGKTQLGVDIINGNPNFKGKPADLIINEVTGGSRSELQGKLEVFGNKANVMIANPNGITCDGCGFINAPGVTLTTGKPQFDKQGALEALEVKKGTVTIGGKGLDGNAQDYVDIISRATTLNGKINANNLSLTQGANRVSFKDGTIKSIAGEGTKPQLAVDTKALGGMYANKIRLVANEDGVGVNLNNINSTQRDITLTVNGRIELGHTHAQTDLNVSAREIHIASDVKARGERDVMLVADALNNNGNVTAHRDIRVFADTVRNVALRDGDNTALHSNNNLWIQKDAQGNKSKQIENRSARIQTNSGDLVIRTEKLDNVRQTLTISDQMESVDKEGMRLFGSVFNAHKNGDIKDRQDLYKEDMSKWEKWLTPCTTVDECTYANRHFDHWILDERIRTRVTSSSAPAIITSGKNSYINASILWNDTSQLKAKGDMILTGNNLSSISRAFGVKERFNKFKPDSEAYQQYEKLGWPYPPLSYVNAGERAYSWSNDGIVDASIAAGGNLVADFKNQIDIKTPIPNENQLNDVKTIGRSETVRAQNVLLHAANIVNTDAINATGNITAIAEDRIVLGQGILSAGKALDLSAGNTIDAWQSELKGQDVTLTARTGEIKVHTSEKPNYYHPDGVRWLGSLQASRDLTLTAGSTITLLNTLLAPQSRNISLTAPGSISIIKNDAILTRNRPGENLSADKRQQYFNNLLQVGPMNATGSVSLNSGSYLALRGVNINAGKDVTLLAGHNVDLNYRALDGNYGHPFVSSRTPELGSKIHAGGNLLINSARDLGTQGGTLSANGNITLLAGQNLWLSNVAYSAIDAANDNNKDDRHAVTILNAGKNLTAAANNQLLTYGTRLTSSGNMTLTSGMDMRFEAVQNHSYREGGNEFTETRTQQGTELNAGGLMTVISNGSILFQATKLVVKGLGANWKSPVAVTDWASHIAVAEQQLQNALQRINQAQQDKSRNEHEKNNKTNELVSLQRDIDTLKQKQAENLRKIQEFSAKHGKLMEIHDWGLWQQSSALAAEGIGITHELVEKEKRANSLPNEINAEQSALNDAQQRLAQATQDRDGAQSRLTTARNEAQSKGADEAKQKAQVDAHNQAEAMRAGNMDIAAKGGYLYAQAMEESSHYEKTEKKRKWWGKKTEVKQTRHDVTNKVTEFTAAGNINLMSRDDSTYEASKISAGQNARLTSTHGQVNFRAVKNTSFEQTISNSKGFFIKQANKGYEDNKWVLPSIYAGGQLTVDTANGVSADVKAKNGQSLQSAIDALGNTPGTTWVKDLNKRNDVQWNKVKDAYDSWDYKSQHLNPAVAAVIAIAAAAVTAGSSLTALAASNVAGAIGGGAVTSGAVTAGMSSLASQAAVALVENQGNLSKTLKALGSNESVKATATAMAIGGALNGFDSAMGWSKDNAGKPLNPNNVKLPQLSNQDWSKVAQRVAGQSVISSSLNTTINGGSFKDSLTNALLANIGSQINAEGAKLIGDNGEVLGVAGKSVSHAVVAGVAAEIGRGDGRGAAAGALAAELAGVIINDDLVKNEGWQEQQAQISRVAGAFAGALATGKADGANSGANAAEIVERFNRQLHQDELNAIKELAKGDKEKEARLLAASCRQVNCIAQESLSSAERINYESLMTKYPDTKYEDSLLANYWVSREKQRYGNYPLYPEMELSQLFTYTVGDKVNDDSYFVLNQWIENASEISGLSTEAVKGAAILLSTAGLVLEASRGGRSQSIVFDGKFYSADNFKFSKEYYERLWGQGRPAPFLQAREIMNSKPKVVADPRGAPGYFKYEGAGLEMIYNPSTKQVGHIQPVRKNR
ncbi:filamentous hemagglutinin [Serratia grimesii]|uniref:Filamentous hemagglutinin n=1 Tax=Serratia grimesii TaxID=82995 RepID=A0ABR4U5M0_9GAMM|nr:filamentous hemagglutinin [Serratia grimesii]